MWIKFKHTNNNQQKEMHIKSSAIVGFEQCLERPGTILITSSGNAHFYVDGTMESVAKVISAADKKDRENY